MEVEDLFDKVPDFHTFLMGSDLASCALVSKQWNSAILDMDESYKKFFEWKLPIVVEKVQDVLSYPHQYRHHPQNYQDLYKSMLEWAQKYDGVRLERNTLMARFCTSGWSYFDNRRYHGRDGERGAIAKLGVRGLMEMYRTEEVIVLTHKKNVWHFLEANLRQGFPFGYFQMFI